MMNVLDNIDEFNKRFKDATPEKVLRYFLDEFGDRIALSSSLSIEDQTLTDILLKINPLIDWTEEQVWEYIKTNHVPYNALHDKGYPSIGCEPCTRAVKPGEDIRAGRWWWESPEHRECGLHQKQ
jgi:3'-phosphoadenosine 5'-phosphosulfate sulfotransferase (PAPS reductase)/FAD synthetase